MSNGQRETIVDAANAAAEKAWLQRFPALDRAEVFDLVTSMFLDCGDEHYIARALSEQFNADFSANIVKDLRFQAALEADRLDRLEMRKKWIFRYRTVTLNNLVKEYMFLTRIPNFFEAKVELADELYWLEQKYSKKRLWIAINDALGRNNIPIELVNAILEFRTTMLRIKQLAANSAKEEDPTKRLLQIAEKVSDAYRNQFRENSIHTADYACDLLGIPRRSLSATDVDFLREYFKCSTFPERDPNESIVRFLEGADTFDKRSVLREAAAGNMANLDPQDFRQLLQEMQDSPILKADQLKQMAAFLEEKMRGTIVDPVFKNLRDLVADHLFLSDIGNFYSMAELVKLRMYGLNREALEEVLRTLNALLTCEEVVACLKRHLEDPSQKKVTPAFASKYCRKRFGVDFA